MKNNENIIHMFDTHCHLNFSAFKKTLDEVIQKAHASGIESIVIPGTDIKSSHKAVEIASKYEGIYVAVGIHPHHVYDLKLANDEARITNELAEIEKLLAHKKVVAVGEVGVDRYIYTQTKYKEYTVDDSFVELQKKILAKQVALAVRHDKSLIIHNRVAKADLFAVLQSSWDTKLEKRAVLHCCEPDLELLQFAKEHQMFLGVDGDLTYSKEKQEFLKTMGAEEFLSRYVLETDAPFLLPEPLRSQKQYPNKPENIRVIAECIAGLLGIPVEEIKQRTTENAKVLFNLTLPQK